MKVFELPGPRTFVEGLCFHVRSGANVVAAMPSAAAPDLEAAFRFSLGSSWNFRSCIPGPQDDPLSFIARHADIPGERRPTSVAKLAGDEAVHGVVFWVRDSDSLNLKVWFRFLEEFSSASRALDDASRGVVVFAAKGRTPSSLPANDVTLRVARWDGVVGPLDTLLFAATCVPEGRGPWRRRFLLASCAASVGSWDLELCERLAREEDRYIVAPQPVLDEIARERNWTGDTEEAWHRGTCATFEGEQCMHSALAVATGRSDLVDRRLWAAQAAAILPMLEQRRLDLIPDVKRHVQGPLRDKEGNTIDLRDLELGGMAYFLSKSQAPTALKRTMWQLRDIRNCLAHSEALPLEMAFSEALFPR